MKHFPLFLLLPVMYVKAQTTPVISAAGIVNAASYVGGSIAPGEIVTIYGTGIGPAVLTHQTSSGFGSQLGSTSVLFANIAAPLVYVSSGAVTAIVPYEISGMASVPVQVQYQSAVSNIVTMPVAKTSLGIFAVNSQGSGSGSILKSDYSPVSATNTVDVGSAILIYATGEGAISPAVADGTIDGNPAPQPLVIPTVTIGGLAAQVLYAGGSPGLVAGLLQVNAVIPAGLNTCSGQSTFPVVLSSGSQSSQSGLTVQVTRAASCAVAPTVQSLSITPSPVSSGSSATGQVILSGFAPAGEATVALSSNSTAVTVPASVNVPVGLPATSFPILTSAVSANQTITITAFYNGSSATAPLMLTPSTVSVPAFSKLSFLGSYVPSNGSFPSQITIAITPNSDNTYTAVASFASPLAVVQYLKGTLAGQTFSFSSVGTLNGSSAPGANGSLLLTIASGAAGQALGSASYAYNTPFGSVASSGGLSGTFMAQ